MALKTTRSTAPTNQEVALEIVKAALLGGALRHSAAKETESATKAANERASLDAVYAVRLYQNVLGRLNRADEEKKAA
ncbi:hypothetical protein [Bordetella sp. 2513F-2]